MSALSSSEQTPGGERRSPAGIAVSINRDTSPTWIDLRVSGGLCQFLVRPLTTAIAEGAQAAASQEVRAMRLAREDLRNMGDAPDPAELDLDDPFIAYGAWQAAYLRRVARAAVLDWRLVTDADTGNDLPFSVAALDAVLRIPEMAAALDAAYLLPLRVRSAEKNGSGPGRAGTTETGPTPAVPAASAAMSRSSMLSSETLAALSTETGTGAPDAPTSKTTQ